MYCFINIDFFPEEIDFSGITGLTKTLPEHGKQLLALTQRVPIFAF